MTESEAIQMIGTFVVKNWQWILGLFSASIIGTGSLIWFISSLVYKRLIALLTQRLEDSISRFSQMKAIMNKQLDLTKEQIVQLHRNLTAKHIVELSLENEGQGKTFYQLIDDHDNINELSNSMDALKVAEDLGEYVNSKPSLEETIELIRKASKLTDLVKAINLFIG